MGGEPGLLPRDWPMVEGGSGGYGPSLLVDVVSVVGFWAVLSGRAVGAQPMKVNTAMAIAAAKMVA